MTATADTLVPDHLWQAIQPLLPSPPRRYGGRPRADDRAALAGIVYQLRTGIPWRLLPTRQLGCGSPVTCWRRLRDWQRAGVWQRLHKVLLDELLALCKRLLVGRWRQAGLVERGRPTAAYEHAMRNHNPAPGSSGSMRVDQVDRHRRRSTP